MAKKLSEDTLIFDWNRHENFKFRHKADLEMNDETLRDGLQSPSVTDPTIEEKLELIDLMESLQIECADIGLPGSGPRAQADITAIAQHIGKNKMRIRPNCAVRTVKSDITPLIEISQKVGYAIEACAFIGSSPIRQYAEGWTVEKMIELSEEAVSHAVENGLPTMYVTEDTTRADPKTLKRLYTAAINAGAERICVCDTVGHVTPVGVYYLLKYVHEVVDALNPKVKIDWHGHSDRGLSLPNALAAIAQGADRIHATGLGIGERVGNTAMDLLLMNLKLEEISDRDLTKLPDYCRLVSKACGVPIQPNYPAFGRDAFRTSTGVHAAAIIKAQKRGDDWLADRVYSGVPAGMVGLRQVIEVGFMSGTSNIVYWLRQRGIEPGDKLVDEIFQAAKRQNRVLTDTEVEDLVQRQKPQSQPAIER